MKVDENDKATDRFLHDEVLALSVIAAFARAHIYAQGALTKDRALVRSDLKRRLRSLRQAYECPVSEETHLDTISHLAEEMSVAHTSSLKGGRFRIGPAQKALNLYLKYLWALGWIPAPPHCPLDANILGKLSECRGIAWTQIDDIDVYRDCIAAVKKATNGKSIPEWEVDIWGEA